MSKEKSTLAKGIISLVLGVGALVGLFFITQNTLNVPEVKSDIRLSMAITIGVPIMLLVGITMGLFGKEWAWYRKFDKFMHGQLMSLIIVLLCVVGAILAIFFR